jgi:hypothetical protein
MKPAPMNHRKSDSGPIFSGIRPHGLVKQPVQWYTLRSRFIRSWLVQAQLFSV